MAWENKRAGDGREPEREKGPSREPGPFTPEGEYDSLEAWADEDER